MGLVDIFFIPCLGLIAFPHILQYDMGSCLRSAKMSAQIQMFAKTG